MRGMNIGKLPAYLESKGMGWMMYQYRPRQPRPYNHRGHSPRGDTETTEDLVDEYEGCPRMQEYGPEWR